MFIGVYARSGCLEARAYSMMVIEGGPGVGLSMGVIDLGAAAAVLIYVQDIRLASLRRIE